MKRSKSKQLAGYVFACYIALVPSLFFPAGFAVKSLLVVLLCQLPITEEGGLWENNCAWYPLRILQKKKKK